MLDVVLGAGQVYDLSTYDLSGAHDIRPLVVETVLTYLELMGIIRATGPFYNEYKFQPTRSSAEMLAKFDGERREFLKEILKRAEKGKTWFKLDLQRVQRETGFERQRIVSAVNYLEEQGDLVVQVAGLRQGYRRVKDEGDRAALAAKLAGRFVERERRDVERLGKVLDFAGHEGCRWRYLAGYFGEERAGGCGHCDHCLGQHGGTIDGTDGKVPGERMGAAVRGLMAEYPEALGEPRQVARFLAGLNSPRTSRARLGRHELFGAMGDVRFAELLRFAEGL
jgi:ATP-dependent DNA helicase RecQ